MLFQSRGGILMGGIPIESGHPELPQHSPADSLKAEVTFQEAASRVVRRRTGTRLGRWGLPTVLFLITSAFVVACGGGNTNVKAAVAPTTAPATATQEIPSSPTAEATPTIQPRPTEQATSTATPSTPEAKKETAPCVITNPELCAQAERIEFTYKYLNPPVTYTFISLNLPEGTPLFSPVDGLLDKIQESGDPFSGVRLTVREGGRFDGAVNPIFRGDIKVNNMLQENVKKGDFIGYTGNSGITNLGVSLLFTITKATPQGGIGNEEALRELFPVAFEKPVKQSFSQEKPGKPNISISYAPAPPQ